MKLTREDVDEILELLDGSSFDEMHLQTANFRLSLRRSGTEGWTQSVQTLTKAETLEGDDDTATPAAVVQADAAGEQIEDLIAVCSPLPGTFYRSPQPGAPPFIEVGDRVGRDTVIGIVETMKLMNSVTAGTAGEIVEICQANAQTIEKDAVLVRIRPEAA